MAPVGTLYTLNRFIHPRSRKVIAAAKVNGLELSIPDFQLNRTNKTPEYLAKFPLGKIPAFESASGFTLTESNAIALFLAESGPHKTQLLGATATERALVQQWIFFSELQLEPLLYRLLLWRSGFKQYDPREEDEASSALPQWLDHLEASLRGKVWLVDDNRGPSLADLTLSALFVPAFAIYVDAAMRKQYPEIVRWFCQVKAVPELTELYTYPMVEKRKDPGDDDV